MSESLVTLHMIAIFSKSKWLHYKRYHLCIWLYSKSVLFK